MNSQIAKGDRELDKWRRLPVQVIRPIFENTTFHHNSSCPSSQSSTTIYAVIYGNT